VVNVPFVAFGDSSRGVTVERHVQCAQSPMHLVESATLRLAAVGCTLNKLWEQKLINSSVCNNINTLCHSDVIVV